MAKTTRAHKYGKCQSLMSCAYCVTGWDKKPARVLLRRRSNTALLMAAKTGDFNSLTFNTKAWL